MIRHRFFINKNNIISTDNYLTIEALENDCVVKFSNPAYYNINGADGWNFYSLNQEIIINTGEFVCFKATLVPTNVGIGQFSITKYCNLKGNCMSMLFGDDAAKQHGLPDYAFYNLFGSCTNIVNVSSNFLPATTLAEGCYNSMFKGCTNLTTAPKLPATTLADSCYCGMFYGCTNLTTAPALPATKLTQSCYFSMFKGCTKLNYINALFTTTPGSSYTYNWVSGVASTGTFVKNKNATWYETGENGVPSGWTTKYE